MAKNVLNQFEKKKNNKIKDWRRTKCPKGAENTIISLKIGTQRTICAKLPKMSYVVYLLVQKK